LLLQATEVQKLSGQVRKAKANSAWIAGSMNALRSFTTEQEEARGYFPGPLPVVYCGTVSGEAVCDADTLAQLADAGASGVLIPMMDGNLISSVADLADATDETFTSAVETSLSCGLQPIPEVMISPADIWGEDDVTSLVEAVTEKCGGVEPVAVVFSFVAIEEEEKEEEDSETEDKETGLGLPQISKELKKRVPILGSVRVLAGDNRMSGYASALQSAGFTGSLLRCDCVPGFRMNPDLDFVGGFWSMAISELKSTKSKTFGFRTKFALARDVPMEWFNYQKDVMESGALGDNSAKAGDLDLSNGDFAGF